MKRIEEMLVDNRSRRISKRDMGFIERYVHVIESTAGHGKTLWDFYKEPSVEKEGAYEDCKTCLHINHGILGTVFSASVYRFSYGYLVYGKGTERKEGADRFYLMCETSNHSYEIEFPSEIVYRWFHQHVGIRGQIIDCLYCKTGEEIEVE